MRILIKSLAYRDEDIIAAYPAFVERFGAVLLTNMKGVLEIKDGNVDILSEILEFCSHLTSEVEGKGQPHSCRINGHVFVQREELWKPDLWVLTLVDIPLYVDYTSLHLMNDMEKRRVFTEPKYPLWLSDTDPEEK